MPLSVSFASGVDEVPALEWDALVDANDPFLEHRFLSALERSGSVGGRSGWLPRPVLVRQGRELVGAVPLYLKLHSYGEFVFDFGWAAAAQRAGLSYYPKLVAAVPVTPVTGSRLLVRPDAPRAEVVAALVGGVRAVADETRASSIHVLFCREEEQAELGTAGFAPRLGMQFHWRNRPERPYADFEDFLSAFRSRNRKQVRRERAVAAAEATLSTVPGPELDDTQWTALETFYAANIDKHDGSRYLTPAFFRELRATCAERVVATFATRNGKPIAGTLNFERGQHLYGRYWGCLEEHPMLHFELCYYRLIERAVVRGYQRFEAGAQGEHKLKRGLDPALTFSAHYIRHPGLRAAIERNLVAEAQAVRAELAAYASMSPYARTGGGDDA